MFFRLWTRAPRTTICSSFDFAAWIDKICVRSAIEYFTKRKDSHEIHERHEIKKLPPFRDFCVFRGRLVYQRWSYRPKFSRQSSLDSWGRTGTVPSDRKSVV